MKCLPARSLLCAIAALACVSCAKDPGEDSEPIADAGTTQDPATKVSDDSQGGDSQGGDNTAAMDSGIAENPLAKRLRLPDMTGLPSDKELVSGDQPDKNGGGVIARPPSE